MRRLSYLQSEEDVTPRSAARFEARAVSAGISMPNVNGKKKVPWATNAFLFKLLFLDLHSGR